MNVLRKNPEAENIRIEKCLEFIVTKQPKNGERIYQYKIDLNQKKYEFVIGQ